MSSADRRQAAIDDVSQLLCAEPLNATVLPSKELRVYRAREITHGWRLSIDFLDQQRRLDVLAGPGFPREPVSIAVVDRPPFLTWAHVEEDGVLCLLPSSAAIDHATPAKVTASIVADACELVDQQVRGKGQEDFRREFLSYWGRSSNEHRQALWSLLRPEGPSRHFYFWPSKKYYLLGESPEQLIQWLTQCVHGLKVDEDRIRKGTLLWLPELPLPSDYPTQAADLREIADSLGCAELLDLHLKDEGAPLVVLGGESGAGPCFAATIVLEPFKNKQPSKPGQHQDRITAGFRADRVPRDLLRTRRFGGNPVARATVDRADAAWIHGRGADARFATLRDATIVVMGCGSLGSHLTVRLAEAGIGEMHLVDPEPLQWANIGRHALSAHHIGQSKADELAKLLRQQYPHARGFRGYRQTCEEFLSRHSPLLTQCDLIVAAMGDWSGEGALNLWHVENKVPSRIVYTWSEAHAAAGHAVVVTAEACLQCGFANNGQPHFRVTKWTDSTAVQEPGCGAIFQPYGPVELAHIVALAAEASLDCLLGGITTSTHRIWCGRRSLLDAAGGDWSEEFAPIAATRPLGGFIEERLWVRNPNCSECGEAR